MEAYDSEREMVFRSTFLRETGDNLPVLIDFISCKRCEEKGKEYLM